MQTVLIRHKVEDYPRWKTEFDAHKSMRESGGEKESHLFRTVEDPNNVVLLFEWDNQENARRFIESEDLRQAMQKAGVVDQPDVYFLDEAK